MKSPEEKAREYATARYGEDIDMSDVRGCTEEIFLAGYHSHDEELTTYREALEDVVDDMEEREYADLFKDFIAKAKQLINMKDN